MGKKVVVGMSGGVDSSVAAYLLKKNGYDVIGVTMQIWQDEEREEIEENGGCCGLSAVDDARRVAQRLDIPYYVMNFKEQFRKKVIDYFIYDYLKGYTPNPCIACNRYIKWESLLHRSLEIGAEFIATGHYAKVEKHPVTNRYTLRQADTKTKDQTYALYNLTQEQLARTIMPIGDYEKDEVRKIAREIGLNVADKPDSQDICFVPDNDYASFIRKNSDAEIKKGNFVDKKGNVLGIHNGITDYTIGQRKGLGLALGVPAYVCEIRVDENEVVIGGNDDLMKREVLIKNFNYMSIPDIDGELRCKGKLRYSQKSDDCVIRKDGDMVRVIFDKPQRAATPGQAAVFYDGEYVIGGGTIIR
ncbi:MAG: tRNA 2-thiouridine(34) synthase MnmA [Firmicutes bacterium]|nr:tRNA 2-thiouridine(34) synthase MnmA [Bacillota bacterium]